MIQPGVWPKSWNYSNAIIFVSRTKLLSVLFGESNYFSQKPIPLKCIPQCIYMSFKKCFLLGKGNICCKAHFYSLYHDLTTSPPELVHISVHLVYPVMSQKVGCLRES